VSTEAARRIYRLPPPATSATSPARGRDRRAGPASHPLGVGGDPSRDQRSDVAGVGGERRSRVPPRWCRVASDRAVPTGHSWARRYPLVVATGRGFFRPASSRRPRCPTLRHPHRVGQRQSLGLFAPHRRRVLRSMRAAVRTHDRQTRAHRPKSPC
jgi:hypothetical protein